MQQPCGEIGPLTLESQLPTENPRDDSARRAMKPERFSIVSVLRMKLLHGAEKSNAKDNVPYFSQSEDNQCQLK
jgi:hypothetical protein